eukprot:scaffold4490_cov130-Isochrysis_galbana.AAC.6
MECGLAPQNAERAGRPRARTERSVLGGARRASSSTSLYSCSSRNLARRPSSSSLASNATSAIFSSSAHWVLQGRCTRKDQRERRAATGAGRLAEGAAHRYSLKRRFLRSRTSIMMYSRTSTSRDLCVVRDHAAAATSSMPETPLLSPPDFVRARFTRCAGSLPSVGGCNRLKQRGCRSIG